MDKGLFDLATDYIKETANVISGVVKDQFKNQNHYRQVPTTPVDRVAQYLAFPQEVKDAHRQQQPEAWRIYEEQIFKDMEMMKDA